MSFRWGESSYSVEYWISDRTLSFATIFLPREVNAPEGFRYCLRNKWLRCRKQGILKQYPAWGWRYSVRAQLQLFQLSFRSSVWPDKAKFGSEYENAFLPTRLCYSGPLRVPWRALKPGKETPKKHPLLQKVVLLLKVRTRQGLLSALFSRKTLQTAPYVMQRWLSSSSLRVTPRRFCSWHALCLHSSRKDFERWARTG